MCIHAADTTGITSYKPRANNLWAKENQENKLPLPTSLHTSMVPNTTWRPSKKLSPMMMTMAPPVVQPSLGLMALMQGVAKKIEKKSQVCPLVVEVWSLGNWLLLKAVDHSKKFKLSFADLPSFLNWLLVFTRSLKPNELTTMYENMEHLANCAKGVFRACSFPPYFYKLTTLETCKSLFSLHLLCTKMLRFTRPANVPEKEKAKSVIREGLFCSIKRQFLITFLTLYEGFPPFFHMFEASGPYIPTGTQYGFQAITKVNPSLHFQSWQGQRWERTLAGFQKHEPPLNSQSITSNQSKETGWVPSSEPWGFLLPFSAHCGRINTTPNSLLIQSFSFSSLIPILNDTRHILKAELGWGPGGQYTAKHHTKIVPNFTIHVVHDLLLQGVGSGDGKRRTQMGFT